MNSRFTIAPRRELGVFRRPCLLALAILALARPAACGDALEEDLESVQVMREAPTACTTGAQFLDPRLHRRQISPDGNWAVWRSQDEEAYWLFLGPSSGSAPPVRVARNGYQACWSPDSRRILFTAMNWQTEERGLWVYDVSAGSAQRVFRSRDDLGPLAAWWPDGSKILFCYQGDLWIMNAGGVGLRMLGLRQHLSRSLGSLESIVFCPSRRGLVLREKGSGGCLLLTLRGTAHRSALVARP